MQNVTNVAKIEASGYEMEHVQRQEALFIITNDRKEKDRVTICGRIELAVVWILPWQ